MAIGNIMLPIGAATLPDATTTNVPPAIQRVKSSATAPAPFFLQAAFDGTAREQLMWSFRMPDDYISTPQLKVLFKMTTATTGNVVIEGRIAAVTGSVDTTDVDAKAFAAANTSSAIAVPATTAGKLATTTLSLTNADSLAAGDFVVLMLARDPANASDTVTTDMEVPAVTFSYTSG